MSGRFKLQSITAILMVAMGCASGTMALAADSDPVVNVVTDPATDPPADPIAFAATDVDAKADTKKVPGVVEVTPLDHGFTGLYMLDFAGAQKDFTSWQTQHPDDPMGPVSEAAGLLFSEFNRLGVLEAQFFENDEAFVDRPKLSADPEVHKKFQAAIDRAEKLAHARLQKNSRDRDGLFAMTLSSGLQADYASLIEKRNFASVRFTKDATNYAQQLLAVCPDCYDALLATGFSKYIVGNLIAPLRWILRMGGLSADKQGGLSDLQTTAAHGHYLAPFARILLAIAYVREKEKPKAIELLTGLQHDFPSNPLFARQIARLRAAK
jgi:hypothetical protein